MENMFTKRILNKEFKFQTYHQAVKLKSLLGMPSIVLKPGPARRVNPGPGRARPGTGPGLSKNRVGSWPGETRNPGDPASFFYIYKALKWRRFGLLKGQNYEGEQLNIHDCKEREPNKRKQFQSPPPQTQCPLRQWILLLTGIIDGPISF